MHPAFVLHVADNRFYAVSTVLLLVGFALAAFAAGDVHVREQTASVSAHVAPVSQHRSGYLTGHLVHLQQTVVDGVTVIRVAMHSVAAEHEAFVCCGHHADLAAELVRFAGLAVG